MNGELVVTYLAVFVAGMGTGSGVTLWVGRFLRNHQDPS